MDMDMYETVRRSRRSGRIMTRITHINMHTDRILVEKKKKKGKGKGKKKNKRVSYHKRNQHTREREREREREN